MWAEPDAGPEKSGSETPGTEEAEFRADHFDHIDHVFSIEIKIPEFFNMNPDHIDHEKTHYTENFLKKNKWVYIYFFRKIFKKIGFFVVNVGKWSEGGFLEKDIVRNIMTYLKTLPDCFFWKEHGGMYGTAGIPDIICCRNGHFYGFEVKTVTGRPTKLQLATIRKINRAGGTALVVRSVDEVKAVLEGC